MGPHPSDIDRYVKFYVRLAEGYQKQKLYCHAGWFWIHLYAYWQYHDYNDIHPFTGRPRDLFKHDFVNSLVAAQPIMMKLMLEKVKCSLRLPNYDNDLWGLIDANDWIKDGRYIHNFGLDSRGLSVLRAQILLCSSLASIVCPQKDSTVVGDLKAAVKAFVKGIAQPRKEHKDVYKDVHDKLCWAIDNYFIDLDSPLRYTSKHWLNSWNHTDNLEVSREGWPTFSEWVNLPVWPE
jgi:hypothetical protein